MDLLVTQRPGLHLGHDTQPDRTGWRVLRGFGHLTFMCRWDIFGKVTGGEG